MATAMASSPQLAAPTVEDSQESRSGSAKRRSGLGLVMQLAAVLGSCEGNNLPPHVLCFFA
jgi:hypothetical protein